MHRVGVTEPTPSPSTGEQEGLRPGTAGNRGKGSTWGSEEI